MSRRSFVPAILVLFAGARIAHAQCVNYSFVDSIGLLETGQTCGDSSSGSTATSGAQSTSNSNSTFTPLPDGFTFSSSESGTSQTGYLNSSWGPGYSISNADQQFNASSSEEQAAETIGAASIETTSSGRSTDFTIDNGQASQTSSDGSGGSTLSSLASHDVSGSKSVFSSDIVTDLSGDLLSGSSFSENRSFDWNTSEAINKTVNDDGTSLTTDNRTATLSTESQGNAFTVVAGALVGPAWDNSRFASYGALDTTWGSPLGKVAESLALTFSQGFSNSFSDPNVSKQDSLSQSVTTISGTILDTDGIVKNICATMQSTAGSLALAFTNGLSLSVGGANSSSNQDLNWNRGNNDVQSSAQTSQTTFEYLPVGGPVSLGTLETTTSNTTSTTRVGNQTTISVSDLTNVVDISGKKQNYHDLSTETITLSGGRITSITNSDTTTGNAALASLILTGSVLDKTCGTLDSELLAGGGADLAADLQFYGQCLPLLSPQAAQDANDLLQRDGGDSRRDLAQAVYGGAGGDRGGWDGRGRGGWQGGH